MENYGLLVVLLVPNHCQYGTILKNTVCHHLVVEVVRCLVFADIIANIIETIIGGGFCCSHIYSVFQDFLVAYLKLLYTVHLEEAQIQKK